MEDGRRRSSSKAARRLRSLLALAGDYLKYLFMNRRRLLGRVARRTLAVLSSYQGKSSNKHLAPYWPPRALTEHEFSCSDSPSPAFLAAKRLRSQLKRGAAAGAAVSSCFGAALRASYGRTPPPVTEEEENDDDEVVVVEEQEDEETDGWACGGDVIELDVDYRAEEFINMFYEQLRAQSFPASVFQCSP